MLMYSAMLFYHVVVEKVKNRFIHEAMVICSIFYSPKLLLELDIILISRIDILDLSRSR